MKTVTSIFAVAMCAGSAFATAPNPGAEWKNTLFLDDFTGVNGRLPNSTNWVVKTGTSYPGGPAQWGTGEIETYTSQVKNVKQAGNGNLWIIPVLANGAWTSGRIETVKDTFACPAGGKMRVEASIKMPDVTASNGLGYWPAFWMLGGAFRGNYYNWPMIGEIDIMEAVNGRTQVTNVLHCDVNPGGACNEPTGLAATGSCTGSNCPGNFHVYEVIIDRSTAVETMSFYVDRVLVQTISENTLGSSIWSTTVHRGFYLVLNVAMGGAYPNAVAGITTPTSATVSGRQMAVDYVAIWTT